LLLRASQISKVAMCKTQGCKSVTPRLPAAKLRATSKKRPAEREISADFVVDRSRVLGAGLSGNVCIAKGKDGRVYALKSFNKAAMSKSCLHSIRREVDIHRSLNHPHIVRLESVVETSKESHLLLECLNGGNLLSRLRSQGAHAEDVAAHIIHQVLLAVAYLHGQGVMHRDLKLENIVYQDMSFQCVKLIDFGLATHCDGHAPLRDRCGTPAYVAPEVWRAAYTDQADMWSLGILTHELLLASAPYPASADMSMIKEGRVHLGTRFNKLSCNAQDFVRSLLEVDPSSRLTASAALRHPWIRTARCDTATLTSYPTLLNSARHSAPAADVSRDSPKDSTSPSSNHAHKVPHAKSKALAMAGDHAGSRPDRRLRHSPPRAHMERSRLRQSRKSQASSPISRCLRFLALCA